MTAKWARTVVILIVAAGGAAPAPSGSPHVQKPDAVLDTEAQLAAVLTQLEAEAAAEDDARPGWSRRDMGKLVRGAVNFFRPFPGGNGRSCATCHDPRDGFSLSPETVEARWQRLQWAKRFNPEAADPLFRSIDADDGQEDFTLLRTRALVKVRVPLPARVRLTDNPSATHVTLSRAVTPLNMPKHTAAYEQDRSAETLEGSGARGRDPAHGADRPADERRGREPGVQPLRHPAAPRDQRDGPVLP